MTRHVPRLRPRVPLPALEEVEVIVRLPAHTAPGVDGRICVFCSRAEDVCIADPCPARADLRRQL